MDLFFSFLFLTFFFSYSIIFLSNQVSELEHSGFTFHWAIASPSFQVWRSGVGQRGADEQLVPADHSLPHVHLVQPDVGLPYQGLLHELASVGHQEQLEIHGREKQMCHGLLCCYLVCFVSSRTHSILKSAWIMQAPLGEVVTRQQSLIYWLTYCIPK